MAMHDTGSGQDVGGSGFDHTSGMNENRWRDQMSAAGNEVFDKAKEFLAWGNARHVIIRRHGQQIVQFPLTVGIIATLLAPQFVGIGVIAAIVSGGTIEIQHVGSS